VGEYTSKALTIGSATALTTGTPKNVTSMTLAAGDWEVSGVVAVQVATATTTTAFGGWVSLSSAAYPWPVNPDAGSYTYLPSVGTGISVVLPTGTIRMSIGSASPVYLTAVCNFGVSTASAYGFLQARRVR
jgi:hypothetical protein